MFIADIGGKMAKLLKELVKVIEKKVLNMNCKKQNNCLSARVTSQYANNESELLKSSKYENVNIWDMF